MIEIGKICSVVCNTARIAIKAELKIMSKVERSSIMDLLGGVN